MSDAMAGVPDAEVVLCDLQDAGILTETAQLVPLSGGVSCEVWRVAAHGLSEQTRDVNPHGLVIKAPLATLRTPSLWQVDTSRGFAEAEALRGYARLTPAAVPRVVWQHPSAPVMAVEAAPQSWQEWRTQMLNADSESLVVSGERLRGICESLGRTLASWHTGTVDVQALPEILRTGDRLRTLRTDVFHRATADQVPEIAHELEDLAVELESARTCLVHGDYSPKNVLVSPPEEALGAWMLDAEVAHVGDPALDVAYLSTHLACKAVARPFLSGRLAGARLAFENAYRSGSDLVDAERLSRHTGAILAARVRGVSRVTYLDADQQAFVLERAVHLVQGRASLDETWAEIVKRSSPNG